MSYLLYLCTLVVSIITIVVGKKFYIEGVGILHWEMRMRRERGECCMAKSESGSGAPKGFSVESSWLVQVGVSL